jgi:hypothetical protein
MFGARYIIWISVFHELEPSSFQGRRCVSLFFTYPILLILVCILYISCILLSSAL